MGKTDPLCSKRYNQIKHRHPKKNLDKRRLRTTVNNCVVEAEETVSKPKFRRGVSQFTKAAREFGERRSEFDSKDARGTTKQRACITKGRLTIPKMGIFMRSKMSEIVVRGGRAHLDEMNQARMNDDLKEIIRLANTNVNEVCSSRAGFSMRQHSNARTTVLESDEQSDIVDDPETPRSVASHHRMGDDREEVTERRATQVAPTRFVPNVTSTTVQSEQFSFKRQTYGFRSSSKPSDLARPNARRRLLFPTVQRKRQTPSDSDIEEVPSTVADVAANEGNDLESREPRLPTGCASLKELYKSFASSYIGDIHKVYGEFTRREGHSSIRRTREELTSLFRKTCERVLKEEGKSVDEENILNMTLQICGPDKYASPNPGTFSSLRDYKQRNKALFPDTDSEGETNESEPASVAPQPCSAPHAAPHAAPHTAPPRGSNLLGLDFTKYPFAPAVHERSPSPRLDISSGPEQEEEAEEEEDCDEVFGFSPEVSPEPLVVTVDPRRYLEVSTGNESDVRRRNARPSVFDAITPSRNIALQGAANDAFQCRGGSRPSTAGDSRDSTAGDSPPYAGGRRLFQTPTPPRPCDVPRPRVYLQHPNLRHAVCRDDSQWRSDLRPPVCRDEPQWRSDLRPHVRRDGEHDRATQFARSRYRLSSDEGCSWDYASSLDRRTMAGNGLGTMRCESVREFAATVSRPGVGEWNRMGADDGILMEEDQETGRRKLDCHTDEAKPTFISPEQRFYQLCLF